MKHLWYKLKEMWWKIVIAFVLAFVLFFYLYSLVRPSTNKSQFLETVTTEATLALKENELRAKLEKDKIGIIKKTFEDRLGDTKKIDDREERLKALIRLHEELDI